MCAVDRLFPERDVLGQKAGYLGLEVADAEGLGGVDSGDLTVLTDEAAFYCINRVSDQEWKRREGSLG